MYAQAVSVSINLLTCLIGATSLIRLARTSLVCASWELRASSVYQASLYQNAFSAARTNGVSKTGAFYFPSSPSFVLLTGHRLIVRNQKNPLFPIHSQTPSFLCNPTKYLHKLVSSATSIYTASTSTLRAPCQLSRLPSSNHLRARSHPGRSSRSKSRAAIQPHTPPNSRARRKIYRISRMRPRRALK